MYCKKCGSITGSQSKRCPKCGYPPERIPELAASLSFLIPGLGHIYDFEVLKGVTLFIIGIIVLLMTIYALREPLSELPNIIIIGRLAYPMYIIFCAYDAYIDAKKMNG